MKICDLIACGVVGVLAYELGKAVADKEMDLDDEEEDLDEDYPLYFQNIRKNFREALDRAAAAMQEIHAKKEETDGQTESDEG